MNPGEVVFILILIVFGIALLAWLYYWIDLGIAIRKFKKVMKEFERK